MEFCSRCGALLRSEETVLTCRCGFVGAPRRRVITERALVKRPLGVIDQNSDLLATFDHVCSRCGHGKARLVSKGVWYTDEDEHEAFVCGKCGHSDAMEAKMT